MKTDKRGMLWVDGVGDRPLSGDPGTTFFWQTGMATKQEETASGRRGARLQRAERRQIADHGAPMTSKNTSNHNPGPSSKMPQLSEGQLELLFRR